MELTMAQMQSRQRILIGAALVALTLLAWTNLLMPRGNAVMEASMSSDLNMLALSIIMWSIMMVAMMLPGAGPMILTYARIHQQRQANGSSTVPIWVFLTGYLTVWAGFGIAAAVLQWGLHQSALLSSAMGRVGPLLAGGLLITAGAFQFSRLKQACLSKCRSPLSFLMTEWREGTAGALVMGIRHGAFCTGCCWALMLLMFVGGVMNLAWMAALALFFLAEKLLPGGEWISRLTGVALIGSGIAVPYLITIN